MLGLLVELEQRQAQLLDDIVAGPLVLAEDLGPMAARTGVQQSTPDNGTIPLLDIDGVGDPGSE